ncbi:site-specific integrase [Spirosoma fluviale]|uniref:Site-specific recombinase XerD n=1 Tax=Spirosoma fluviale TaxID=1597977 RepID=A0A286F701_9BACT|nr:site-specific integrase [Spirosoma fluviale]SOD78995.1 Site-specific recombinase XerD [Spirosoma fluviale]
MTPDSSKSRNLVNSFTFTAELNHKPKLNGDHALFLRITADRKIKRIYTGFDIPKKDWNPIKKTVRRTYPLYKQLNERLIELKGEATTIKAEVKGATAVVVIDHMKGKYQTSFFAFADNFIEKQAYNTSRNVRTEVNKFKEYIKNDSLVFTDITTPTLYTYHEWLIKTKGNSLNTANKGLSKLRTVIGRAIEEGLLKRQDNPFLGFKMKEAKPERIRLTEEELQAFIGVDLPEDSLIWHTRNYWLFAYYTAGVRFSDVSCLKWENIVNGRLSYVMRKTQHVIQQEHTIQIPKQAEAILCHYRKPDTKPKDYLFPILSGKRDYTTEAELLKEISRKNALINKYLKTICLKAGIPKDLSFHSARHTFADLGRRKIKDVYAISKLLRHSKINITENYLKDFDTEVTDQALDTLFG